MLQVVPDLSEVSLGCPVVKAGRSKVKTRQRELGSGVLSKAELFL